MDFHLAAPLDSLEIIGDRGETPGALTPLQSEHEMCNRSCRRGEERLS
jgi:hypothetical protein